MRPRIRVAFLLIPIAIAILLGSCRSPGNDNTKPEGCTPNPFAAYPRLYIETFNPYTGPGDVMSNAQTVIALLDASGNQLAITPIAGYQALDYTCGLDGGTYYVRISEGSTGEYGIRVLTPADDGSTPAAAAPFATQIVSDPYEPDDPFVGDSPPQAPMDGIGLYRVLGLGLGDIDYIEFVLP